MLSLCLHGPQSERASLVSLVPSEQWGQPSLAVWWGRGGQGPRPWGRGGDGPGWWEEPVPVPPCAPLPQPEARFSVLLLLSQPQVETAPGLPVPTPAPELVEWWPEVWGAPLACLLSSSPPHWVLPVSGPRGGDGVPRDLVLVSHNPMPVWACAARPPCAGPVSPCVRGRGPGPAHYYSPESCVTDSPKPEPTHFPFLRPAQASPPQVSRRERLGSGWLPQSPLWFHPPSLGTQPWAEEEKPCILLLSPWNVL